MDKLAYLPGLTVATHDEAGQTTEPTVRQRLALVPDPDVDVPEQAVSQIEAVRIHRLVAELPKLQRLVISWHFGLDGLTLSRREIADRLRLSPAAVLRLEAEALQHLRGVMLAPREVA